MQIEEPDTFKKIAQGIVKHARDIVVVPEGKLVAVDPAMVSFMIVEFDGVEFETDEISEITSETLYDVAKSFASCDSYEIEFRDTEYEVSDGDGKSVARRVRELNAADEPKIEKAMELSGNDWGEVSTVDLSDVIGAAADGQSITGKDVATIDIDKDRMKVILEDTNKGSYEEVVEIGSKVEPAVAHYNADVIKKLKRPFKGEIEFSMGTDKPFSVTQDIGNYHVTAIIGPMEQED